MYRSCHHLRVDVTTTNNQHIIRTSQQFHSPCFTSTRAVAADPAPMITNFIADGGHQSALQVGDHDLADAAIFQRLIGFRIQDV